jgi:hypothetical protein
VVYVRLTKAEQAALVELAAANRRRVADEAGLAVAQHIQRQRPGLASQTETALVSERIPTDAASRREAEHVGSR